MSDIPTWLDFATDFNEILDSNELTDEDRKCLIEEPGNDWLCKELDEVVKQLTDAKLMNSSLMFYMISGIKLQFLALPEAKKQEMSANEYRKYSKWVLGIHKILELPVMKALNNMITLELTRRADKITQEMRDKRLKVLFSIFPTITSLFKYLLKNFNDDDDIPIGISFKNDDNPEPYIAISKALLTKAEEHEMDLWRSLLVEFLGNNVAEEILQ